LNAKNLDSAYTNQLREIVAGLFIRIDIDERNEERIDRTDAKKTWDNYYKANAGLKLAWNSSLGFFCIWSGSLSILQAYSRCLFNIILKRRKSNNLVIEEEIEYHLDKQRTFMI
jgi:hypothetical protein